MKQHDGHTPDAAHVTRTASALGLGDGVASAAARLAETLGKRSVEELVYDLQVHQIELEMQNETLRQTQAMLEASRTRYVNLYEFAPVGYLCLTPEGMVEKINLTGARLLGSERKRLLNRRFADLLAPADGDDWQRLIDDRSAGGSFHTELLLQRGDGSSFHARLECTRFDYRAGQYLFDFYPDSSSPDGDGALADRPGTTAQPSSPSSRSAEGGQYLHLTLSDISERKHAEDALREQMDFFHLIAENIDEFIAVLDLRGRRLYVSPSYHQFFGDEQGLLGTDSFAIVHPDDRDYVKQVFSDTIRTGEGRRIEYRMVVADSRVRDMESYGNLIRDRDGRPLRVVVVAHDVTERKKTEQRIRRQAFHDPLTRLPNRRLLYDRMRQCMSASARSGSYGALMFLDLDNFKPLNDAHGHDAGDLLLVEVAHRLQACIREMDTVARIGGDEFVVMINELNTDPCVSRAEAQLIAEKIRASVAQPYLLRVEGDGAPSKRATVVQHQCTVSIGVVLFSDHAVSQDIILKWADSAMYAAKGSGRNAIHFHNATS